MCKHELYSVINGKKICYTCLIEKDTSEFNKRKTTKGFSYRSECSDCEKKMLNTKYETDKLKPTYVETDLNKQKTCIKCGEVKNISEFSLANKKTGSYYNSCKCCRAKESSIYSKNRRIRKSKEEKIKIEYKQCNTCGQIKSIIEFNKNTCSNDGFKNICVCCEKAYRSNYNILNKERKQKYNDEYKVKNKDIIKQKQKLRRDTEEHKMYQKEYRKKNKERLREQHREYERNNKQRLSEQRRKNEKRRLEENKQYKLYKTIKCNLFYAFRNYSKNGKINSCSEYGIDFSAIYNKIGPRPHKDFQLDHIIPVRAFNFDDPEHVRLSHIPENLRWIHKDENNAKKDKIIWSLISSSPELLSVANSLHLSEYHDNMNAADIFNYL